MKVVPILALLAGLVAAHPASAETLVRIGYPGAGLDDRPFGYGDYPSIAHVQHLVETEFKTGPT